MVCTFAIYSSDQVKDDEMGGACGTRGQEKCVQSFSGQT